MSELLLFSCAYLLGSVPTALWVSRIFFGIDIRAHGSRNMGASNTFRVLGAGYGLLVLVVDMLKGCLAVALATKVELHDWMGDETMLWQLMLGLTAVLGHIFPVFAGFRGGKGIATLFGVVLTIQPWMALIAVLAFVLVVVVTRYISLASLLGVLVFAVCVFFAVNDERPYMRWFAAIAAIIVFAAHLSNIKRLLKGTENKFSFRKRDHQSKKD